MSETHDAVAFDLFSHAYAETAVMEVENEETGLPSGWKLTFAGPNHPITVELGDEIARRAIRQRKDKEQAQVNGRKWKADDETPKQNREDNANFYARRMLGWEPAVRLERGEPPLEFSQEAAAKVLANPKYFWLYRQVARFLEADAGFIPRSKGD
jgi:hypothetical protein